MGVGASNQGPIYIHVAASSTKEALLAGLIGVLLGGVLHLLVERRLDRSRNKARLRAAGQLLSIDLLRKLGALVFLEQMPRWPSADQVPGLTERETWQECRADLAYANLDAWLTVGRLYVELDGIEQAASRHTGQPLTPTHKQQVKNATATVTEATALLNVFGRPPPPYALKRRINYYRERRATLKKLHESREQRAKSDAPSAAP